MVAKLNDESLAEAVQDLIKTDAHLRAIYLQYGNPPLWAREHSFKTLLHIILEQQVSLASALATLNKLIARLDGEVTPETFLTLDDVELRAVGFSRQKTRYGRILSQSILSGDLDLAALANMPDADARKTLMKLKGIGKWTADIYLLMVLCRPDVWPTGDRALAVAARNVLELDDVPSYPALDEIALRWQP
ncbi:MAG: DNA-3-methyladenine glycosylase family protein, partial [Candidatus Promineifilaceae bacterium]